MNDGVVVLSHEDFELVTSFVPDCKYVAITASDGTTTEAIRRYLPRSVLTQVLDYPAWIAAVEQRNAQWLADRLASGLYVGTIHDTYDAAQEACGERMYYHRLNTREGR